ncbi:MAG: hypothetical protein ACI3V0_05030 [Faecousia sp.]
MENDLESKLGAILSDPEMMQKIQAMAQSLSQSVPAAGSSSTGSPSTGSSSTGSTAPNVPDLSMLQKLGSLAGQAGIDSNQQALLSAMSPYLSAAKVQKLEKAMRAAKMARLASSFLGSGGLQLLTGRSNHV